jgi:hypothetical protein
MQVFKSRTYKFHKRRGVWWPVEWLSDLKEDSLRGPGWLVSYHKMAGCRLVSSGSTLGPVAGCCERGNEHRWFSVLLRHIVFRLCANVFSRTYCLHNQPSMMEAVCSSETMAHSQNPIWSSNPDHRHSNCRENLKSYGNEPTVSIEAGSFFISWAIRRFQKRLWCMEIVNLRVTWHDANGIHLTRVRIQWQTHLTTEMSYRFW